MKYCVHIILKDNKVLLLKRKLSNPSYPGIWTPVVGKIKPYEKPFDAVVRETKEETSLEINLPKFVKHCIHDEDEYWFYHSNTQEINIKLNHENERFDFFEKHLLPDNLWSFFKSQFSKI